MHVSNFEIFLICLMIIIIFLLIFKEKETFNADELPKFLDFVKAKVKCQNGFTFLGGKCIKSNVSDAEVSNPTCPSGYTQKGSYCVKDGYPKEQAGKSLRCKAGYNLLDDPYNTCILQGETTPNNSNSYRLYSSGSIYDSVKDIYYDPCKDGVWIGGKCVEKKKITSANCPDGSKFIGGTCRKCPLGKSLEDIKCYEEIYAEPQYDPDIIEHAGKMYEPCPDGYEKGLDNCVLSAYMRELEALV